MRVTVSQTTMAVIMAAADRPFKQTARKLPNGNWELDLAADIIERLETHKMPSETWDDILFRVVSMNGRKVN